MNRQLSILFAAMATMVTIAAFAQTPAFPGAEGFGMYTTGGRGGRVYHVTSLLDDGKTTTQGTLRWACSQAGPRTIVFDVSGTIFLQSALKLKENTTLAGQTAPGDGICIAGYQVTLAKNNIIRFIRFRPGDENGGEPDGLGAMDSENIIVDHCSVSWSVDECLSVYGSHNTTVQWCIASQSLCNSTHVKKAHGYGGNWGGSGASYHHNLVAHHVSRTPRLGPRPGTQTDERMDMRCNVIYNWIDNGVYGGEGMNVNIVNNYYKPTAATKRGAKGMRIAAPGIRTSEYTHHDTDNPNEWDKMWHVWGKFYVEGNVNTMYPEVTADNWTYGVYNQIDANGNDGTYTQGTRDSIRLSSPIAFVHTTTHSAEQAFQRVLDYAGASLHRDALDEIIVSDARQGKCTFTASGNSAGIIDHPSDVSGDGWTKWPTLAQTEAPADTDGDGMPDKWERAQGLNPGLATDGSAVCDDGYTNLEHYLNSLVQYIVDQQNQGGIILDGTAVYDPTAVLPVSFSPAPSKAIYRLDGTTAHDATAPGLYIIDGRKVAVR